MPLSPGTRIGPYEVLSPIGAGGMGEVHRARDTGLAREVAIKVLPDVVSGDPERIARFEREARALAALSHSNIAAIYGLENVTPGGFGQGSPAKALILELVEGETLQERLARGRLPLGEALRIAAQIADALEAAHERGIVHRDLKPANVKVTPAGVVKVLDFGLARIVADASNEMPTMTLDASGTEKVLGTPAYMAPEQAQGRPVDKRADVWSFGVLLYEMIAGRPAFRGTSIGDTIAAVLTAEPEWDPIPPHLRPLLRRLLEREPRERLRDIGDFRFLLEHSAGAVTAHAPPPRTWPRAGAIALAIALGILGLSGLILSRRDPGRAEEPVRFRTLLPEGVSVMRGPGIASSVAISPDGRVLVVAGAGKEGQRLYRQSIDRLEAVPVPGTERGSSPFFSWDGTWLGFAADGRLKRVPAAGGAPVDIVAITNFPAGASWAPDDRIVFAYGADSQLHIVDARGGSAGILSDLKPASRPDVLPDGRTVLFVLDGWVHILDRTSGRQTRVVQGTSPRYAAGHLIFFRGTNLFGAALDLSRHELTTPVVPLVENVAIEGSVGSVHYGVSAGGTLVYVPAAEEYAMVLVGPEGGERVLMEGRAMSNPQFSPDGRSIAVSAARRDGEPAQIWVLDVETGTTTRLTSGAGRAPVWADDRTVTYSRVSGEGRGIYQQRADGSGEPRQVVALDAFHWLVGWTPDRTLAYGVMEGTPGSIVAYSGGTSRRVVGPGSTWGGRLSRDGQWLVYYSLDSGNFEIYVTPFPGAGTRWLIADGTDPTFSRDGNEVYYRSGPRLMAARIDKTSGVRVLSHRVVVEPFLPPLFDDYDIHPDGRTLVMLRPAGSTQAREVSVVLNWFTEMRRSIAGP